MLSGFVITHSNWKAIFVAHKIRELNSFSLRQHLDCLGYRDQYSERDNTFYNSFQEWWALALKWQELSDISVESEYCFKTSLWVTREPHSAPFLKISTWSFGLRKKKMELFWALLHVYNFECIWLLFKEEKKI